MDQSMFLILLIAVVPIGIYMYYRKKKNKKNQPVVTGKKKKLDSESWLTIKKYLKENGETGKEIVELFIERRFEETDSTNLTKEQKKTLQAKEKEKKLLDKKAKKQDPKAFKELKKDEKHVKKPELWLLYFVTRNAKTLELDEPRIIEAQISHVRKTKKDSERVITVNDKIDFNEEMLWLKPLKDKQDEVEIKNLKEAEKKQLKQNNKKKNVWEQLKTGFKSTTKKTEQKAPKEPAVEETKTKPEAVEKTQAPATKKSVTKKVEVSPTTEAAKKVKKTATTKPTQKKD